MKFYKDPVNPTTGERQVGELTIDSLTVFGLGKDSLIYNNKKLIKNIDLPLNKLEDYSQFIFIANDTIDTITVHYARKEEYVSFECGISTTFTIDTFFTTYHYIDSILLKNNIVDTENAENFHIYHTPRR